VSAESNLATQREGDRQVVIFTFAGNLTEQEVREWNAAVSAMKQLFGNRLIGVTIRGEASLSRRGPG
jgi:hypothetical protein